MSLDLTGHEVERDSEGVVRQLRHPHVPYQVAGETSARSLAERYLAEVAPHLHVQPAALAELKREADATLGPSGTELRFSEERKVAGATIVSFVETHFGLPIWQASVAVTVFEAPTRVVAVSSTYHTDVDVHRPSAKAHALPQKLNDLQHLTPLLFGDAPPKEPLKINRTRLLIYRYDPTARFDPESEPSHHVHPGHTPLPRLPLPPVPDSLTPGVHRVATEVLFTHAVHPFGPLNWRAFFDTETGAVLMLRALLASASCFVYAHDPATLTGNPAITPASAAAVLDPLRTKVPIMGLPPAPNTLDGQYVKVSPPAPASASGDYLYSVPTVPFSQVNAYYHVDAWFRLVQELGFSLATFFEGTIANPGFPVPLNYLPGVLNAFGLGNASGDGSGGFSFGIEQTGTTVGIATDHRVVSHEFSHALLWDAVNSPNFGFCHSAGDSLAVILNDPGSKAPDRFLTFPWITAIPRRHDRRVSDGWAWKGVNDDTQYLSEQIMSTLQFRIYRALGGDAEQAQAAEREAMQHFAARYCVYLIVGGIGSLTATNTNPAVYASAMMNLDLGTPSLSFGRQTVAGGAVHKVIRWSWEKAGLYQPPGAPLPVTTEGAPPAVDVFIDDGRHGEYDHKEHFWENLDVWSRHHPDGGTAHQTPWVGVTNYAYARVKNRGTEPAPGVVVSAYHCPPTAGLVWPDDLTPMTTESIAVTGALAPGASTVVGPFNWTPASPFHDSLLASVSAAGDPSNLDAASLSPVAAGPAPHWFVVPFDNNIASRTVAPVAGGGGADDLVESLEGRRFVVSNPYRHPARATLHALLPPFLKTRGWDLTFASAGGGSFALPPRGRREIILGVVRGADFTPADVPAVADLAMVRVELLMDQVRVGGVSYLVDATLEDPPKPCPPRATKARCVGPAKHLLKCLKLPASGVTSVKVRRVTVDIEFDDCAPSDDDDGCEE
jgi:hypothetical protein